MVPKVFPQTALVAVGAVLLTLGSGQGTSIAQEASHQLLAGDRVLLGTVEAVRGDQAQIDTGEVQPRFIPMGVRRAKGLPDLKKGDRIELTVNDQNLLVDVHLLDEVNRHSVVKGQLIGVLETGHDRAVLRTSQGKEESHGIRPVARSKVASVPVGVDAIFLIDEMNRIVDVTFGSKEAVHQAAELWQKKSPLKGNFGRVVGTILRPLDHNTIVIQTEGNQEERYEVRPFVQDRLKPIQKGATVVLLLDEENKVGDVAIPPK